MIPGQPKSITPRQLVRRTQARTVLRELRRKGIAVTVRRIELHAIARYAGELSHALIQQVVTAAVEVHAQETGIHLPVPKPRLSTPEVMEIVERELERDPGLQSSEILPVVEELGRIPMQRQSFPALVGRVRKSLGIPSQPKAKQKAA